MKGAARAPAQRRKRNRNYLLEYRKLQFAAASLKQVRSELRYTGAVQTIAAAERLRKSIDGAMRHAHGHLSEKERLEAAGFTPAEDLT